MPDFKKAREEQQRQFRTHQVVEPMEVFPPSTLPDMSTSTFTSTSSGRHRGAASFEQTHSRVTLWLDNGLKQRFEALAKSEELAKSALFDEAVRLLLQKYQA